jgi:hypothetical protein
MSGAKEATMQLQHDGFLVVADGEKMLAGWGEAKQALPDA